MMDSPSPLGDVRELLARSEVRARAGWFWYAAGVFLLVVLVSTYISRTSPEMEALMRGVSAGVMFLMLPVLAVLTWLMAKRHRVEQQQVEAIEELVQLRRWEDAARLLQQVLSRPMRTPQGRAHALIYLTSVLARYERFADMIEVQEHLLEEINPEDPTAYGLKLGRAMAMLRQDHLVDADRAMGELRRERRGMDQKARGQGEGEMGGGGAGLTLVEMYRDVKTGHAREAVEFFEQRLGVLREQLGHRLGDAYALAARALDMLGEEDAAQQAYEKATLLTAPAELHRKYPETRELEGRYAATVAPPLVELGGQRGSLTRGETGEVA
jgi:tetratricopeptide (TPR) repeat protein